MTGSPTFIAKFADGEITRMTTHCSPDKPDVERGVRLSQHAYRSRTRREPPAIIGAWVESEGETVAAYDRAFLEATTPLHPTSGGEAAIRRQGHLNRAAEAVYLAGYDRDLVGLAVDKQILGAVRKAAEAWADLHARLLELGHPESPSLKRTGGENAPPPDVGADNMRAQIAALDDGQIA
jgi:hypothetical protein